MERLPNEVLDNALGFYKTMMEMCKDTDKKDCPSILDRATVSFLEELKEYRRLEKEGLILKLPCKEGDTVYTIDSYIDCCNKECKLTKEECDECSNYKRFYSVKETKFQIQMIAQLGRVLFLTKEEAEQKLREM